jgi:protein tyrosine phosphatase (PTP) superfamily phosphohydrolase (DUF442 family)
MYRSLCIAFLSLKLISSDAHPPDSLESIPGFQRITDLIASSGNVMDDQFDLIKKHGFTHVISLLQGDQSREDSVVTSKGMSFTQIPVDPGKPKMKDLEAFIREMGEHGDEMVYLYCQGNIRVSAFLFIYRVTQLGTDKRVAKAALEEMWYPTDDWHDFIQKGLEKYGFDPEYRFEPTFIQLIRQEGIEAAGEELSWLQSQYEVLPFTQTDLQRLADEYARDQNTDMAIQILQLNGRAFPDSWKIHDNLGDLLIEHGDEQEALGAYEKVLELNPDHIWARRMLGKLGVAGYAAYWEGVKQDPELIRCLQGTYDLGDSRLEFFEKDGKFMLKPSWTRKAVRVYADSPDRYFIQENDWMFEFLGEAPGSVRFINKGRTLPGMKIE